MLLELMLNERSLLPAQVNGFENAEFTHSAVAAYIASGMADVGFGVQTAAQRFKLDFIPLIRERYFFAVPNESLEQPQMQRVIDVLRSESFRNVVNQLPGYDAADTGSILTMHEAFGSTAKK